MKLVGTLPRSATGTLDGFYSVDELFENHRVVNVCSADHHTERDAPWVRNKVALRACFSFIRRILAGFRAPLLAGMEAESKTSALPLYLVGFAKAVQERLVQTLPDACLLPTRAIDAST